MRSLIIGTLALLLGAPGAAAAGSRGEALPFRSTALADPGCAGPAIFSFPGGGVTARTVETSFPGDPLEDTSKTRYWSCLDGRRRSLGRGESSFGESSGLSGFRANGSLLGYTEFDYSRSGGQEAVVVRDLRTSRVLGSLRGSAYDGSLDLRVLDAAGRVLVVDRGGPPPAPTFELLTLTTAGRTEILDPAAPGEISEAALDADGTATWRRGGDPRSARVP